MKAVVAFAFVVATVATVKAASLDQLLRSKRQANYQPPVNEALQAYNTANSVNQALGFGQQPQYNPYAGPAGYGAAGQVGQCNPCYPTPGGGPEQWCTRDTACNPAPGYCNVVCGLPNKQTGGCDYTFQCGPVAGAQQTTALATGTIITLATSLLF